MTNSITTQPTTQPAHQIPQETTSTPTPSTPTTSLTFEDNLGLVYHVLYKYSHFKKYDQDDLFQEGCIGLMNAIKLYDPSHKVAFSTYAHKAIYRSMHKYINSFAYSSFSHNVNLVKLLGDIKRFVKNTNPTPTESDILNRFNLTPKRYAQIIPLLGSTVSIHGPVDSIIDAHTTIQDVIQDPNSTTPYEEIDNTLSLSSLTKALTAPVAKGSPRKSCKDILSNDPDSPIELLPLWKAFCHDLRAGLLHTSPKSLQDYKANHKSIFRKTPMKLVPSQIENIELFIEFIEKQIEGHTTSTSPITQTILAARANKSRQALSIVIIRYTELFQIYAKKHGFKEFPGLGGSKKWW